MTTIAAPPELHAVSRFGTFALDERRALLTRAGEPVALRPKTFALLSYLARHPGRVLGKEELLAAVWPGVVVSDESLSQCVRELRNALGDGGQTLIRTLPRRGYLFDVALADAAPAGVAAVRGARGLWAAAALVAALLFAGLALLVARGPGAPAGVDAALPERRSIAVLPFDDAGGDAFGDVIADDLTATLAKLPGTLVVAFASSAVVAAREADARRIGRELGVRHLLGGSVQRDGAVVHVSARFVSTDDGSVLWSGQFVYPEVDAWNWPRDIGAQVARALDLPVPAHLPATAWSGRRLDAIDATLHGQRQLRRVANVVDLHRARALFERALAIDPDSASAWTGLARTYLDEVENGWSRDRETQLGHAERAIARANQAAPDELPALGLYTALLRERGDLDAALAGYQMAVAYNPSAAWGHARIAAMKLRLGRPEEVVVHADMALRLSPFEPALVGYSHLYAGLAEFYLDREDAAYERMRLSANAGPTATRFGALLWLVSLAALNGRDLQAAEHAAALMSLDPGWTIGKWRPRTMLTHPRLVAGRERFAEGLKKAGLPE